MTPTPIKCDAKLPDGSQCQEVTAVARVQQVYDRQPVAGGPDDYILREIHYFAVCPKCGERRIVEPVANN